MLFICKRYFFNLVIYLLDHVTPTEILHIGDRQRKIKMKPDVMIQIDTWCIIFWFDIDIYKFTKYYTC